MFGLFKKFEFYQSIDDMPIYNWLKIQDTNDLLFILKNKYQKCNDKQLKVLELSLQAMTDQFIDRFGVSDSYRQVLRLKGELRCKEIDYLTTGSRTHLTFIEIKKKELQALMDQSNKKDSVNVSVHVRKYNGGVLDMKKMNVVEFYEILEEIKREQKRK